MNAPATIGSVEEVRRVAEGLTKAPRGGLTGAWRTPAGRMAVSERCEGSALVSLEDADLVDGALCLTPLGIAVRNHLLASERGS